MKLQLPKTYDNPFTYMTGHDFIEAPWNQAKSQTWDYFERYRLTSWGDIAGSEESESTVARWWEQDFKDKESIYPDGYYNEISGETEESSGDIIPAEEANEKYGLHGRLNFTNDVSIAEAQVLHERKIAEMKYQDVYNRAHGFWKNAGMIGVGMGSALWDPANIGAMFIPIGGQLSFLANVGRVGLTSARFWRGFKAGAIFTTAFEIPTAAQLFHEQADYSLWHSLMNVSFGSVLGGGLHIVGGRGADWMRGISHKRHEAALKVAAGQVAAGKDIDVSTIIQAARNIAKSAPEGKILDEVEAARLLKEEYETLATGKIPPSRQIEYKPQKDVEADDAGPTIGHTEDGGGVRFNQQDHALDLDQMDVVSSKQLGSNKGGMYSTPDGTTWYVKNIGSEWAVNEMLAGWILKILKGNVPEVRIVHSKGKVIGVASKWVQGAEVATLDKIKKIKSTNPDAFDRFADDYVIHAWLGNWDFAAPGNLIIKNGEIISIDHGGSLLFRAKGQKKLASDFGENFKEIVTLLDKGRSHHAIVRLLDEANIQAGIAKLYTLDNNTIILLGEALKQFADPKSVNKMISLLLGRRMDLKIKDNAAAGDFLKFPAWLGKSKFLTKVLTPEQNGKKIILDKEIKELQRRIIQIKKKQQELPEELLDIPTFLKAQAKGVEYKPKPAKMSDEEKKLAEAFTKLQGRLNEAILERNALVKSTEVDSHALKYTLEPDVNTIAQKAMDEMLKNKPKYQAFHSSYDAEKWIAKQIKLALKHLTYNEKKVLKDYQHGALADFNHWLRAGRPEAEVPIKTTSKGVIGDTVKFSKQDVAKYKAWYDIFKKLEDKFGVQIATQVHRKTGAHHLVFDDMPGGVGKETDLDLIIGKQFLDDGYQSTSITELKALHWMKGSPDKNMVIHYNIKKNQSVIFAGASGSDMYPNELEVLLPPNTWIIKHAYWKDAPMTVIKDKKWLHIYVEARPKKGDPDAMEGVLPSEVLASSQNYHKNVKSNVTAETKLTADDTKLSKVEETLKVEADPEGHALKNVEKEIEEIFELGGSLNNKKINAEIADAKLIIKESKSKVEWLKKGLSAAANCMIGKI